MNGKIFFVVGSGGREHAICWNLAQSSHVYKIYVAPGNCGMAEIDKVELVQLDVNNNDEIGKWCVKQAVELAIIGPEVYLANGLADTLTERGIFCFGPGKLGAQIETDKEWSKLFMDRYNIPTAKWKSFTSANNAMQYVYECKFPALVVKATGLAGGKGVVVASSKSEACQAINDILTNKKFGTAGDTIIIEERLEGEEVSMLAFTDGDKIAMMPPIQDHKRIVEGDLGPNTGGMGAYGPCKLIDTDTIEYVRENILEVVIRGMKKENIHYIGILYAGIMLTNDGPKVLEFNCRFGDPETQIILPLLKTNLYDIILASSYNKLCLQPIHWHNDRFAAGVVLASRGYPETSSKGQVITGVDEVASQKDHFVFHSGTARSNNNELLTNGGRVLMTTCLASSLELAVAKATMAARNINFDGKKFRRDIGHKGIVGSILQSGKMSYKNSGVDIEAGDSLVSTIKPLVMSTTRSGVLGSIGGFGGLFDIKAAGYKDPILVSGTDGVGTKLKIAIACGKHDSVGIDLVAMCVNDVLAHGAEPLFFLDYFACGHLDVNVATQVISGVVEGCKLAGCSLIGGETAEMPDMYAEGDYDLAGFAVGAVERIDLLPQSDEIVEGDLIIGLPSSGVHSNGFSLVRKVLKLANKTFTDYVPFSSVKKNIGDELLKPTKIYTKSVIPALKSKLVKGFAHITGGGLIENIPRVLPKTLGVTLDGDSWEILPVFSWLAIAGGISESEMLKTFNCGIGAIIICSPAHKTRLLNLLKTENPTVIGQVNINDSSEPRVKVRNFSKNLSRDMLMYVPSLIKNLSKPLKKVGVLISGSGTNLQALIDATKDPMQHIGAEIVIVISNKWDVEGLKRAERYNIPTMVIQHTDYSSRELFDDAMNLEMIKAGVEIVCLAGFMRILSAKFVKKWHGALLNIHPALLPSFKGANAHKDALAMGVRITGCTVHFVEVEIDSGAIIEQEAVEVYPNDTVNTLQERVKLAEHRAYPKALKHLATGRVMLKYDGTLQWNN